MLYDTTSQQQVSYHSSSTNLGSPLLEVDVSCIALQDQQVSLQLSYFQADVLEKLLSVFLAVWRAFQNPG